jgi:hypothetical protein
MDILTQARNVDTTLKAARDRYLSFARLCTERRAEFIATTDETAAAHLHTQLRKAELKLASARAEMERLEMQARALYREWLHSLRPGDLVRTHSDEGWIAVKVAYVRRASIRLANGKSFSNLTGKAWRGHTSLKMPDSI